MPHDTLYILSTPNDPPRLSGQGCFPAWLAYRLTPELRLLRSEGGQNLRGGVMVISGEAEQPHGDPLPLCRTILRECALRGFRGVLLDADSPSPVYESLARLLSRESSHRGVTLFLPEPLAPCAPGCRVLIPSALSGGSLEQRLSGAVEQYGADRVVLAVEQVAEDFLLPAPTGCGKPLSTEELNRLTRELHPAVHFSRPLCARYFTYCRGGAFHLVLFDDRDTFKQKITRARTCGVHRFLLPWCDISDAPGDFLPQ